MLILSSRVMGATCHLPFPHARPSEPRDLRPTTRTNAASRARRANQRGLYPLLSINRETAVVANELSERILQSTFSTPLALPSACFFALPPKVFRVRVVAKGFALLAMLW